MNRLRFSQFPLTIKIVVALTLFNSWVLFEETVVDRWGLWHYLPFYKVGLFCIWDVFVLFGIVGGIWWAARQQRHGSDKKAKKPGCMLRLQNCIICR